MVPRRFLAISGGVEGFQMGSLGIQGTSRVFSSAEEAFQDYPASADIQTSLGTVSRRFNEMSGGIGAFQGVLRPSR